LRICLLCYRGNPYSGGQGIYLKYIAEELHGLGHEVHVITGPPYPDLHRGIIVHYIHNNQYFIRKGNSIIDRNNPFCIFNPLNFYEMFSSRFGVFPEIMSFSIRAYLKLRELLRTVRFDIIHDNQCLGYGLLLIKSTGVPLIATIHHPLVIDLQTSIGKASNFINKCKTVMFYPVLMQKIVSKRLSHIITVSRNSRLNNNKYFSIPMSKQTVIYNGVDIKNFRPIKNIRKKSGKILFVGNITDEKKGFPYLVKAMKNADRQVMLTVIDGGSPHRKGIYEMIREMGVSDRIDFIGKITEEELAYQYNEAEIAVVPSVYEGFGFPAAEAMACGTPVIASDGGALPEVVGDAGIIVPARNSLKLAESINTLISDKKAAGVIGRKGIERVRQLFTWQKAVQKMTEVYKEQMSN
jgi:glycosyltransferase involved in cell wall biosynthesis